ncbi:MAG: hypothetical protein P4M09_09920 [Devosia sp.]|nr:hypothetical protein [Devosia sp.]
MRTIDRRSSFSYARPNGRAVPTLLLALFIWAGIFGLTLAAWSLIDLLR